MSDSPAPDAKPDGRYGRFWFLSLGILVADQVSKWFVAIHLPLPTYFWDWGSDPVAIVDGFWYIVHIGNTGAAWGILTGFGWLLSLIAIGALLAVYRFRREIGLELRSVQYLFGMLCGGIVGNLIDRVLHGHVIDFIDIHLPAITWLGFDGYRWPAFNIADAAIFTGVFGYILITLFGKSQPPPKESRE